jgi:uncharacterized protein (DUF488 family)
MAKPQTTKTPLYTIGYEGTAPDAFLAKLQAAGVKRVIDAREVPLSRKKGFSKTPLQAMLAGVGIDYAHLKALGTPKPLRDAYKRTHDFGPLAAAYDRLLDERAEAMHTAYRLAVEAPSALLCYEADAAGCHRSILARRMAAMFTDPAALEIVDL